MWRVRLKKDAFNCFIMSVSAIGANLFLFMKLQDFSKDTVMLTWKTNLMQRNS